MDFPGLLREIGLRGLADIALMAILIYAVLVWFKRARAAFVLTGIVIFVGLYFIAHEAGLRLTAAVFESFFAVLLIALVVIFQEELRHFFERVALWSLARRGDRAASEAVGRETDVLVRTLTGLARQKIGALVVLRGRDPVVRHVDGGVPLDGEMSLPLLVSLFDPHSAGHDGAVIVEGGRVTQFAGHLPLSKDLKKLEGHGTRHAAALGMSELTDALCLVVSEESGTISAASDGDLRPVAGPEALARLLEDFRRETAPPHETRPWRDLVRHNFREKIAAIALAGALWFVVVHESAPVFRTFTVPVAVPELPHGLVAGKVEPAAVRVTVHAPRRTFYFLDEGEIRVFLKPLDLAAGSQTVGLTAANVSHPKEVALERIEPGFVEVTVEKK